MSVILAGLLFGLPDAAAIPGIPGLGRPDGSQSPQGTNQWDCAPTESHPRPVVLVHGTWDNQNAWDVFAPRLKAEGYCVFSLNYGKDGSSPYGAVPGVYATGDITKSAVELGAFVDRVRTATGAAQVDLVGHSQGALVARQYLRFAGGADGKVARLVSIAGSNHGTFAQLSGSGPLAADLISRAVGVAAAQQMVGSEFLRTLNAAGDTDPGIRYTAIASTRDDASQPPSATFLTAGPGASVANVWVQDVDPDDSAGHADLPNSPAVATLTKQALAGP
ncbi:esterase/lipase family protein [Nocardia sp. NPDC052566]|uniref:esterase/lipase family protein n=1 Tax=Nocardia sp. NPDC052566 TaxID=3364330 RepID=UPI0037C6949E